MLVCGGQVYISCTNYVFSNNDCYCCWLEAESFKWGWGFDYTIVKRYFPAHPLWDKFKARGTYTVYTNLRPGQYLTHAHSHITRAVAVMDSCFAPIGAHQYGIAVIVLSLSRIKMSKIQVNQQWSQSACSLRGRPLKGKEQDRSAEGAQGKGKGTPGMNLPSSRSSVPPQNSIKDWLIIQKMKPLRWCHVTIRNDDF